MIYVSITILNTVRVVNINYAVTGINIIDLLINNILY